MKKNEFELIQEIKLEHELPEHFRKMLEFKSYLIETGEFYDHFN